MMFFRRKPQIELTPESYALWLRAQRPDMAWFLKMSAVEQEALAGIGDEYMQDLALAIGFAVADPQMAEAGIDAIDDPEAEETLVRRLALDAAQEVLGRRSEPVESYVPPKNLSMGGVTKRRAERDLERKKGVNAGRRILGRAPDKPTGYEGTIPKEESPPGYVMDAIGPDVQAGGLA